MARLPVGRFPLTYPPRPPWLAGDDIKVPLRYRAAGTEGNAMSGELIRRRFHVTAPYVTLKVATPDGVMVRGLYDGAYISGLTDEAQARHHLDAGLIEEVTETPPGAAVIGPDTPVHVQSAPPPDEGDSEKPARPRAGRAGAR